MSDEILKYLNRVIEKYKDKVFCTGELNYVDMAKSCKLEIERLNRLLSIEKEYREKFDKDNQRLYKIINETSEILKFHLSNPSQTINGWHIDIWNSKDIEKLNKMLEIIEVKEENNG